MLFSRQFNRRSHLGHGGLRHLARLIRARFENVPDLLRLLLVRFSSLLDGCQGAIEVLGHQFLAVHAPDLRRSTFTVHPVDDLTWASAVDMKGLENRFVCVIDIDELESQIDIDQLYVTLSRPRAGLWVATRPQIGARIAELYKEHAAGALEALTKAGT